MSVILNCETSGAPRPAITWQKGKGAEGTGVRASMATRASSASSTATWLSGHQAWPMAEAPFADGVPPCHPGERILASGSVQLPRFTLLESGSLLVSPAHLADAGTYACLATNSRGVDEASADLVVWGKAPASVPASPGSACRPVCLHGAGWTLTSSVGSWVLSPAARGAGWSSLGVPRMGSGTWLVGLRGCKLGLSLADATPAALRVPMPHPMCPSPPTHSKDTYHRPATGPERHQRDQSHHELWGHPRPQRGCQVCAMGLGGLWGGSGHPQAACLPSPLPRGLGEGVGKWWVPPSPALHCWSCSATWCPAHGEPCTPVGPLVPSPCEGLQGVRTSGYPPTHPPPPAQVRLGEGRGTAERGERPTGAPGRDGHPAHLPDLVGRHRHLHLQGGLRRGQRLAQRPPPRPVRPPHTHSSPPAPHALGCAPSLTAPLPNPPCPGSSPTPLRAPRPPSAPWRNGPSTSPGPSPSTATAPCSATSWRSPKTVRGCSRLLGTAGPS